MHSCDGENVIEIDRDSYHQYLIEQQQERIAEIDASISSLGHLARISSLSPSEYSSVEVLQHLSVLKNAHFLGVMM